MPKHQVIISSIIMETMNLMKMEYKYKN